MRAPKAFIFAVPAALWLAPPADAHSVMKVDGGTIQYTANDDVSLNDVVVTEQGSNLRFVDRGANGGITPAQECTPGETDSNGWIIEVSCPRAGITTLRIDVGEAQDKITAQLPLNVIAVGGGGADTITSGDGADILNGGPANDTIHAGGGNDQLVGEFGDDTLYGEGGDDVVQAALGADTVDGGAGNDDVRLRDGVADRAVCADGADKVQADDLDQVDGSCETVDRQTSAAPPSDGGPQPDPGGGGPPPPPDTAPPRVRAGGSTLQRVGRTSRVVVLATTSEPAELVAGGYVTIGEDRLLLKSGRAPVKVGGGGAKLTLTLPARDARKLRRYVARRRASATITVVATDTAGNSSATRLPRITLKR
jgi:hemolysin type calcium-binding protein